MNNIKAGFVGFGEVNSPRDVIEKKCREAGQLLEGAGLELIATQPVSDDAKGEDASRAISDLAHKDFDVLVLCIAGWIPSQTVIRVADHFRHKPMVLWGLAGFKQN